MMKRIIVFLFIGLSLIGANRLSEKWSQWIKKVNYIITPFEKEVFLSLKTDKQREDFINKFWIIRDPIPETRINEFKEEYEKRWEYVNSHFGFHSKKDGWKTDMGRIYLLLGKPMEIQHFETHSQIYPCQLWLYKGDRNLGLPAYFYLIFYKRKGIGNFILYNPAMDGPENLLTPEVIKTGFTRYEALKILHRISPELARASTSYLMSEGNDTYTTTTGGSSNWVLQQIFSIPQRIYDNSIKNKSIKGYVKVSEYLVAKKSHLIYSLIKERRGYTLNLALQPENIAFIKDGDIYKANLILQVILRSPSGKVLFEKNRDIKLKTNEESYLKVKKNPIVLEEIIPVVPGLLRLTVLMKNLNDRSYYTHDEWINVNNLPYLQIVPSFNIQNSGSSLRPFSLEKLIVFPTPSSIYRLKDQIFLIIYYRNLSGIGHGKLKRLQNVIKDFDVTFKGNGAIILRLYGQSLGVGKYNVELTTKSSSFTLSADAIFYVSSQEEKSHPSFVISSYESERKFLWDMGKVYTTYNKLEPGLDFLRHGFPLQPELKDYLVLSEAYLKAGKPEETIKILLPFMKSSYRKPRILMAEAYIKMKKFSEALGILKSIKVKEDVVYKLMGNCYSELGKGEKAINMWEKSLKINPSQEELQKKISQIKQHK